MPQHTIGGTELNHTTFHHNSIHDILGFKEGSLLTCALYNDGMTGLYDVYDNMLYFSNDDESYVGRYFFKQTSNQTVELDHWSNTQATFESPDKVSFSAADYPGAYPFKAGAKDKDDRSFMMNYNKERYNQVASLAGTDTVTTKKVSDKGSKISLFYTSDKYVQKVEDIAKAKVEFFKNGQSMGTQEVELFAHAPLKKFISRTVMYVPAKFAGCDTYKVTCNKDSINFVSIAVDDFDYATENAKRDVKLDAEVIPAGSFDRVDVPANDKSSAPVPKVNFTEEAAANLNYWMVPGSRANGFFYNDVTIDKVCDKLFIVGQTNYRFGFTKASIYLGSDATGEKIGEVDFSEKISQGEAWSRSNFEGALSKALQPGTYDLYVKFDNTSDAEGDFGMSVDFDAIVLY